MKKIGYESSFEPINIEDIKIDYESIINPRLEVSKMIKEWKEKSNKGFEDIMQKMKDSMTEREKELQEILRPFRLPLFCTSSEAKHLISREVKSRGYKKMRASLYLDIASLYGEYLEHLNKCLDEVERMREKGIDQNITFYDILVSKEADELASYVRNKNVAEALKGDSYKNDFPIYFNDLKCQFKIGSHRLSALNIGEIVTKHFIDFRQKEGPFNLKVAEYLSN